MSEISSGEHYSQDSSNNVNRKNGPSFINPDWYKVKLVEESQESDETRGNAQRKGDDEPVQSKLIPGIRPRNRTLQDGTEANLVEYSSNNKNPYGRRNKCDPDIGVSRIWLPRLPSPFY